MIAKDIITKIIIAGASAPSGGNSQPWKFEVRGDEIKVIALPLKDHPVLNFRFRGTWVAHGALIENIKIAATQYGLETKIAIFPFQEDKNVTTLITLIESALKPDLLSSAILRRTTNRKPFDRAPLTDNEKDELLRTKGELPAKVILKDKPEELKELGEAMSVNEAVMLENQELHKLFFKEVVWNEAEEQKKGGGLLVKTLELGKPQRFMLGLCRHWPIMNLLNRLGMARTIAKDNGKVYGSAGAMGVIVVNDTDEVFIDAGRAMERIWLTATNLGLSFHLITGILFFSQKFKAGETAGFSTQHIQMIEEAYKKVESVFGVQDGVVALLFRVGHDGEPSARSLKPAPHISFTN